LDKSSDCGYSSGYRYGATCLPAQADARQQCPPETISIVEFHPSWRARVPMNNSFENTRD
jgi:hypothetical protein